MSNGLMLTLKRLFKLGAIKARLPGGTRFQTLMATRKLKNTRYEFIHSALRDLYWHNGRVEETLKNGLLQYQQGDCYDLGIIKIPCDYLSQDVGEQLIDLIFPYLSEEKGMSAEGTYEEFGVCVHRGDVVIDAGANIGVFTAFSAGYRGASCYSFEVVPKIADMLQKTIALNGIANRAVVVPMGLGDHVYDTQISVPSGRVGASSLVLNIEGDTTQENVRVTTVDQFVRDYSLERVDFIKADIEGSERFLLAGAKETLAKFKPQLSICTYHLPDDREVLTSIIKEARPDYEISYGRAKLYAK